MEAFQLLTDYPVDLIVLDLDLPDITGIQLLESLVNAPPVIVLADHAEQAVACYDLDVVVDFLLKPAAYLRFLRAVQRALLPQFSHSFVRDTNLVAGKKGAELVRSARHLKRVVLDDIHYAKG
ncbi:MAG: hypothetical protein BGO59_25315 [Spirosoma sp. 48-14]|nr:MAG: hypothetical protein BGO59_25315 [Spirosoma sp. 48-14]